MRSTWKRALSAILTVCMIATLLVVPAAAATFTKDSYEVCFATTKFTASTAATYGDENFFSVSADTGAKTGYALTETNSACGHTAAKGTPFPTFASKGQLSFTPPKGGTATVYCCTSSGKFSGTIKVNGTAVSGTDGVYTFETTANTEYVIKKGSAEFQISHVKWAAATTTPTFVTAVAIKGDNDVENPVVPVRDENVTVNLTATVTGGTKGTVKDWKITNAAGTEMTADNGLTLTAGTDEKSATLVIDASKVVRGKYTISATSVDPQQGTEGGETAYMTGSTTLTINRAVLESLAFNTATQTAVTSVQYGAEPIELVTEATWAENSVDDCIIKPADTADAVTWESSNTDVATVSTGDVANDGKGTLTIVGVGTTTITATSVRNKDDGNKATATLSVTVGKGETALKLSSPRNKQVVSAGGTLLFTLDGVPSNATKQPYEYVTVTPSEGVTITAPESGDKPYDDGSTPGTAGWNVKVSLPANGETTDKEYTVTAAWGDETNDLWTVTDDTTGQSVKVLGSTSKNIKIMGQTGSGAAVQKTSGDASLVLSADAVLNNADGSAADDQTGLTFTWKHGDQELTAGGRVAISQAECQIEGHQGHTESTLTISNVVMADAGTYTCVVTHSDVNSTDPIQATFTVNVAKAAVAAPQGVDYEASTRALSGVSADMEYSLDGKATWKAIDSVTEGVYTVPAVDAETAKAVTGVDVRVKETTEALASEPTHIVLKRAQTPALQAGNASLIVTNYDTDFHGLYQVKGGTYVDWTDVTDTASDDGTTTTISGLVNGTEYQVQVKDKGHVLKTLTPATGTPKEPAGDPTELKELIQEAKNKIIGIWYSDSADTVNEGAKFVSVADGTTYNTAIAAAETVANKVDADKKPAATTTELNAAKAALQTAMSTFDGLTKQDGTKHSTAYVLNMNEVTKQTIENQPKGTAANTVANLGTKGYFTLLGNKDTSAKAAVEDGDVIFADGFYGYQRWNPQGKTEISSKQNYKAIKITTTVAEATVTAWVRNNGDASSSTANRAFGDVGGTYKSEQVGPATTKVVTFKLGAAGTYYLGGIENTLHVYRLEVVEPGVDPNPASYDITVAAAENGTVKTTVGGVDADSACEGDEVTIVATPANTGFTVDTVKVTKADNSEVTVTENKFTMPAEAVTVTVTFKSTGVTPTTSDITKAAATNGSFTVKVGGAEVTEAAEGSTVVVTPTAAQGYEVDTVTTTPAATVTEQDDGTYTFPMPGEAVTVTVTFKEVQVTPTEYTITVTAGANGTATASAAKAAEGTKITLTITPAQGYEVDQITSSDVTVAADKTFTMPAKNVTISVTFKQTQTPPTPSDNVHTFESKTLTQAAAGSAASGAYAEDNYFTLVPSAKTKYDQSNKEWKADTFGDNAYDPSGDNAVSKVVRFNMGGATKADGPAIKFTTAKDNAKVQIWWVQGGGDTEDKDASGNKLGTFTDVGIRQIALMKTDATVVEASTLAHTGTTPGGEGRIKANDPEYTELTVATAGTYMIGSAEGSNYIFKIVVTEDAGTIPTPTEHNITVTAGEHGTATASAAKAVKDTEITLTITPEQGYEVDQITSADVTVANNKFTMPDKDVAISVTFKATTVTPPQVDKTALDAAITAAEAVDVAGVKVSEDGADVPTTEKWIAKDVKDAFDKALTDAKAVAAEATQETVDAAAKALTDATKALTDAIENAAYGTKAADKTDLTAAIEAAKAKMEGVLTSANGSDVDTDKTWVTAAVKTALENAIQAAQDVVDNAEATDEDIAKAVTDLNTASDAFKPAAGTKSSGGYRPGSSSGSGSNANTTDKKTETLTDGTKRVTETAKDGTVTVTDTKPDGTKTVTVTTPAGETTIDVTLGHGTESVQVTVPVDNASSGLVAVIVKPDGTEEIIRDSVVVDDEVIFDLDENAKVKVVNNTKSFVDVPGHWAESDVNFVTARDLFNGVSDTHFAPNATMTRSMMATVLYRLDGETKADKSVDFSDVTAGDWFAAAVDWASEAGVINGYTDGTFGPNRSITREELVVMIYRYAGSPEVDAAMGMAGFNDVDQISTWAEAAMRWAVQNGIIQGKGNGTLDPQGNASRAEVSAVLQRYVRLSK